MASTDWFRHTEWSPEIEATFEAKLKRARTKAQYLRIQACTLAGRNPSVALRLLERYFALGEHLDLAQAFVDQATALLALGRTEQAVDAYESALRREQTFPSMRTRAAIELPYLIALAGLVTRFRRALDVLDGEPATPVFPVDRFQRHAARALILQKSGKSGAREEARLALEAAAQVNSGFRYHPGVGLVSDKHSQALAQLRALCDS